MTRRARERDGAPRRCLLPDGRRALLVWAPPPGRLGKANVRLVHDTARPAQYLRVPVVDLTMVRYGEPWP